MDQARKDELWFALWQYTSWITLNPFAAASRSNRHGKTSMKFDVTNMKDYLVELTPKRIHVDAKWVMDFVQDFDIDVERLKSWARAGSEGYSGTDAVTRGYSVKR
jgi:hypothetical protein